MYSNRTMNSIEKSIRILDILSTPPFRYKVSEIAEKTYINRTTVYRILQYLEQEAIVTIDQNNKYHIGPALYHMGISYLNLDENHDIIYSILSRMSEELGESVGLAFRENDRIISKFEINVNRIGAINELAGRYFPVYKGCYGKCLMAYQNPDYIDGYLNTFAHEFEKTCENTLTTKEELISEYHRIISRGYVDSIEEVAYGVAGVGIPLFNSKGEIIACVATAFYMTAGWEKQYEKALSLLRMYKPKLEYYVDK